LAAEALTLHDPSSNQCVPPDEDQDSEFQEVWDSNSTLYRMLTVQLLLLLLLTDAVDYPAVAAADLMLLTVQLLQLIWCYGRCWLRLIASIFTNQETRAALTLMLMSLSAALPDGAARRLEVLLAGKRANAFRCARTGFETLVWVSWVGLDALLGR
jgi:hypothetical protein